MHDKIGPIVINVSRVVVDIFTISLSYALFCLAFTFGIVFVLNIEHETDSSLSLNSTLSNDSDKTSLVSSTNSPLESASENESIKVCSL